MLWNGPTDGSSDCSPAFKNMLSEIFGPLPAAGSASPTIQRPWQGSGARDRVLEFPSGLFTFKSPIPPLPQMAILGQTKLATVFIKQFHGGTFFQQYGNTGNGLIIERLSVLADTNYNPGYFCYLAGSAGSPYQPDNFQLRELYVSQFGSITGSSPPGGGLWQNGIVVDGIARTHPQGVRIGVIENCELFNCMSTGVYIRNGVGIRMAGGGCYPGSAASLYPNGTGIYVAGGAALAITGASGGSPASITTAVPHGLVPGDTFTINGCSPSGWNGQYVALNGTGVNQLNFTLVGTPGGMTVMGTVTNPYWNSTLCEFTDVINNCVLNISRSSYGSYTGGIIGSLATDDSSHWRIQTACPGPVANNLVDSYVNLV